MSFEIQQISAGNSNTATFTFSDTVRQFIVGINHFNYAYGKGDDHAIETMALHLSSNLISVDSGNNNAVHVTINRQFNDASGADYDPNNCSLQLSCLAVIGNDDLNAGLFTQYNIDSGNSSPAMGSTNGVDLALAVLSGFDFSYGQDTDHFTQACHASAGTNNINTGIEIVSSAALSDHSGHSATCSIDGALLSYAGFSSTNLLIETKTYQDIGLIKTIEFGQAITGAAVFLQQWTMNSKDDDDHRVLTFYVGPNNTDIDLEAGTVSLSGPGLYVKNDNDQIQSNDTSNITLVVVATT